MGNWMLNPNLLKSKVLFFFWGGGGVSWKLDAKSKFAKIQSSHFQGGGKGRGFMEINFQLLMLNPNLLTKKKNFFVNNFLSFRAKMCLGMVFGFEYQVVGIYEVYANHKKKKKILFTSCSASLPTL